MCKNVHKCASQVLIHQNVYLKYSLTKKRAKKVQKSAETGIKVQKRCISNFLDPIQKRASSRSLQLEAVQLKALLYFTILLTLMDEARHKPFSRQIGWLFVPMDKKFFCHF